MRHWRESPCGANSGDRDARNGRADQPREIERHGVQRHRIRQIVLADQLRDEGLADQRVEGGGAAEQEGEDMPELTSPSGPKLGSGIFFFHAMAAIASPVPLSLQNRGTHVHIAIIRPLFAFHIMKFL